MYLCEGVRLLSQGVCIFGVVALLPDGYPLPSPLGESAILLRAIGSRIRDHLALPWVPPLLRTPKLQYLQVGPLNSC